MRTPVCEETNRITRAKVNKAMETSRGATQAKAVMGIVEIGGSRIDAITLRGMMTKAIRGTTTDADFSCQT